jgi:hypothetical protein
MAYVINKFNGEQLIVLEDGTIDTSTSVGLVGRNYVGYGETQNENFIYLLENFANRSAPSRPLVGQMWFNTTNSVAYVYNGSEWGPIGAAVLSETSPIDPTAGALWLRTTDNTLYVWLGAEWRFIGPEAVPGFGSTRARATTLNDQTGTARPVIIIETNNVPIAVCTSEAFEVDTASSVFGVSGNLIAGINLSTAAKINGSVTGNAGSADRLSIPRAINGVQFDGQQNITIKSATTNRLLKGTYITGNDFDGSTATTWSVDATSSNVIGKVVARNSEGGFSAGTIAATFVGNLTGNVTSATGTSRFNIIEANTFVGATLTGNANSASQLATARRINGVLFNGTSDITVPAASNTLTGTVLSPSVTQSSLESVGNLANLSVANTGITVGSTGQFRLLVDSTSPIIRSLNGKLRFDMQGLGPEVTFIDAPSALSLGGPNSPAIISDNVSNLGIPGYKFNSVYATYFKGADVEVSSITSADVNDNITANGNLIVTGNLTVQGNVTAVNSTELTIEDKLITLASGAATAAEANGAGIFINGSGASVMYSSTGNKWVLNKVLDTGSNDIITTGLFRGTATTAQYADLAENYVADKEYEPGTVLEIGGEYEVTLAQVETNRVAGIVSTNPAYLMNSQCAGRNVVAVALQGRVPCKVTGKINKGDMLVSAGNGFAKSTNQPQFGTIVGKSLENFDGIDGIIEVLVGRN